MPNVKKEFSRKLKSMREKDGYSTIELAKRSRLSRQHIRDLERGSKYATLKTLCKLANAFEVPIWQMVRFENKRCHAT
ncbi:MAG TPA: helix-turn-helix transcriptional regulator [Candidatus Eisenbacteria bacterium]|nr:helix-turn-helix transcriptional regulator [Candidatus Eisenbacteria bacterium]